MPKAELPVPPSAPLAAGTGQSILVVDAEATRLSLLGNALSSQGYVLQLASDGAAALRAVGPDSMPALVILDGGAQLLTASALLSELSARGYRGAALLLRDEACVSPVVAPPGITLHALRKRIKQRNPGEIKGHWHQGASAKMSRRNTKLEANAAWRLRNRRRFVEPEPARHSGPTR